jgi:uncharacterized protein (DUF2062 family)
LRYFAKRILRLSASPHAIALGFAAGVLVSWTPFVGFHFLMSAFLAFVFGGNLVASAFGTLVGNPVTFPFMWWLAYVLGGRLLGIEPAALKFGEIMRRFHEQAFEQVLPVLKPMLVGAVPLGIASGALAYFIVRLSVAGYQAARRRRLAERRDVRGAGERRLSDAGTTTS